MKNIYIGIDNGLTGAIAFYNPESDNQLLKVVPMPIIEVRSGSGKNQREYNIPEIVRIMQDYRSSAKLVILEKAQPYPGIGATAVFTNARNYGIMEGILVSLGFPYQIHHPKTWQKKMFEGMPHQDTKQASVVTAQRLFPGVMFLPNTKSTIISNGMTDAALMAYYGYMLVK